MINTNIRKIVTKKNVLYLRMSELDMKDGWTPPYYSCLTRAWMMSFLLILPNQIKNDKK